MKSSSHFTSTSTMSNPTEDEEFVVIKAGPPLPLRRPRPLKSNSNSPRPFPNYSAPQSHQHHKSGCPLHNQTAIHHHPPSHPTESQCQPEPAPSVFSPQPITSVSSSLLTSVSKISSANSSTSVPPPQPPEFIDHTQGDGSNSNAKPTSCSTPTSTPTPTITPHSRSTSPVTHYSTSTLKSRPSTPSTSNNVESKVKQYIEGVKKFDEEQRFKKGQLEKKEKFLSLEDLYQIPSNDPTEVNHTQNLPQMEEKLRETLRVIKEKDAMIDQLRESCHDLKLKWADAENRIDEMRFGIGFGSQKGGSSGASPISGQGRRSSFTLYGYGSSMNSKLSMQQQSHLPKRSSSEISLSRSPMHRGTNTEEIKAKGVDKATETDKEKEEIGTKARTKFDEVKVQEPEGKSGRKIETNPSQATTEGDEELSPDFDLDSRESHFDPVLEEKCSNWLEKIQNWKIDPLNHNINLDIKDKDSCCDRDSGFRGSAELEQAVLNSSKVGCSNIKPSSSNKVGQKSCTTSTTTTSKSTTKKQSSKPKGRESRGNPTNETLSPETTAPTFSPTIIPGYLEKDGAETTPPLCIPTMAAHFNQKQEEEQAKASFFVEGGHQGQVISSGPGTSGPPSSLQYAQPWNTFTGNVNPYSATDYEGFPSIYSSSSSSRLDKQQYSSYNSHASPHHHHRSISMDRLNTGSSSKGEESSPHHAHHHGQRRRRQPSSTCDQRELFNRMDKRFQTLNPLLDSTIDIAMRLKEKTEDLAKILQENNIPTVTGGLTVNVSVNNPVQSSTDVLDTDFMNSNRFRRSKSKNRTSIG